MVWAGSSSVAKGVDAVAPSKFSGHPEPFKPEPPDKPEILKRLFCGRERALRQGTETLGCNWDYDGVWGKTLDKRPWIIHGESRSGKSHLARRILIDMQARYPDIISLIIPARRRDTAQRVLETLFQKLRDEFNVEQTAEQIVLKVKAAAPHAQQADIVNSLTAAYCPVIKQDSQVQGVQKVIQFNNFSDQVYSVLTSKGKE